MMNCWLVPQGSKRYWRREDSRKRNRRRKLPPLLRPETRTSLRVSVSTSHPRAPWLPPAILKKPKSVSRALSRLQTSWDLRGLNSKAALVFYFYRRVLIPIRRSAKPSSPFASRPKKRILSHCPQSGSSLASRVKPAGPFFISLQHSVIWPFDRRLLYRRGSRNQIPAKIHGKDAFSAPRGSIKKVGSRQIGDHVATLK